MVVCPVAVKGGGRCIRKAEDLFCRHCGADRYRLLELWSSGSSSRSLTRWERKRWDMPAASLRFSAWGQKPNETGTPTTDGPQSDSCRSRNKRPNDFALGSKATVAGGDAGRRSGHEKKPPIKREGAWSSPAACEEKGPSAIACDGAAGVYHYSKNWHVRLART